MQRALRSTLVDLGAPLGEGKSGFKAGIVNTKVARWARAGQTPPLKLEVLGGGRGRVWTLHRIPVAPGSVLMSAVEILPSPWAVAAQCTAQWPKGHVPTPSKSRFASTDTPTAPHRSYEHCTTSQDRGDTQPTFQVVPSWVIALATVLLCMRVYALNL